MAQVPTGTTFFIASAFGSAINTTAVSNSAPGGEAVVTTAGAHSYSNGDIVEITSGWGRLNKRAFRIKAASGSTLTLEGMDTTNTTYFPAGSGVVRLRDTAGTSAVVATINNATPQWFTATGALSVGAAQKYDLQFAGDGANQVSIRAVSIYQR